MFKIAVRSEDTEMAHECLELINEPANQDPSLLYACVLESQKVQDKKLTLVALQLVLHRYEQSAPPDIHLPALLRCIIRMLIQLIDSKETRDERELQATIEQVCKTFEAGRCRHQKH